MQTFPAQSPVPTPAACLAAPATAPRVHQRWRCVDEDTGKVTKLWVDEAGDWHVAPAGSEPSWAIRGVS